MQKLLLLTYYLIFILHTQACGSSNPSDLASSGLPEENTDKLEVANSIHDVFFQATGYKKYDQEVVPTTGALKPQDWKAVYPGGETICSRGDEYVFFVKEGDPEKVLLTFDGGGACWSEETCKEGSKVFFDKPRYNTSMLNYIPTGILDHRVQSHPLKDYTHIFLSYCSGDVFMGNNTKKYSDDLTIHHKGAVNTKSVLDYVKKTYKNPKKIALTGCSAGAYGSVYHIPEIAEQFPASQINHVSDGGAGVLTPEFMENGITNWGMKKTLPLDVPGLHPDDIGVNELSLDLIYERIGLRHPEVTMGQINNDWDYLQLFFLLRMDGNIQQFKSRLWNSMFSLADRLPNFRYYLGKNARHCYINRPFFYRAKYYNQRLSTWFGNHLKYGNQPSVGPRR